MNMNMNGHVGSSNAGYEYQHSMHLEHIGFNATKDLISHRN